VAIVDLDHLSHTFGDTKALDGLSFQVEEGEIFGLIGPDGAGKTTCLRILCGLIEPTGGRAMVLGHDVASDVDAIKPEIGYMAQPAGLYDDLSVQENIRFYANLYQVPRDRYERRLKRLMDFSGLSPFTGRLFRNLSGGMKQKVGLACALIHTPKILFLDEPTNGVDPVSRRDFWKILYELQRDKVTILVSSTYLDEADRCHRVAVFDRGRVLQVKEPLAMRELMIGTLYELTVTDRQKGLRTIRTLSQVLNPYVHGTGIHFSLKDTTSINRVEQALTAAKIEIVRLEPIKPTLEDVYLSIIRDQGRRRQEASE
jgi:ABC-2 type transport system ATP-binding protein